MLADADNYVYANPDDIRVIFCTTPSFSTIPNTFYPSIYNDNAAVYLGSLTFIYILDISCDTTFTTVFTTVTLDVTAFISSCCLTRNLVCSILAHLISNFNSEIFHSLTKGVRFSILCTLAKCPPGTSEIRICFTFQEKSLHLFFRLF